jgi:hypothetical protein
VNTGIDQRIRPPNVFSVAAITFGRVERAPRSRAKLSLCWPNLIPTGSGKFGTPVAGIPSIRRSPREHHVRAPPVCALSPSPAMCPSALLEIAPDNVYRFEARISDQRWPIQPVAPTQTLIAIKRPYFLSLSRRGRIWLRSEAAAKVSNGPMRGTRFFFPGWP